MIPYSNPACSCNHREREIVGKEEGMGAQQRNGDAVSASLSRRRFSAWPCDTSNLNSRRPPERR